MLKHIADYLELCKNIEQQRANIDLEIEKCEAKIERLNRKIGRLDSKREECRCSWYDDIVVPLMKDLERMAGDEWHGEIYGPFGIFARTTIYLKREKDKSITEQPCYRLLVTPPNNDGVMEYGTGVYTNKYPATSIAGLNGENEIMAVLPDTIEEVWEIVKRSIETEGD